MKPILRLMLLCALLPLLVAHAQPAPQESLHEPQQEALFDPVALLASWRDDPSRTLIIDWHARPSDMPRLPGLEYRMAGSDHAWTIAPGSSHPFPLTDRTIYRTALSALRPDTLYEFRVDANSVIYRIRTLPDQLTRPLRFVVGGDNGTGDHFDRIAQVAREQNPDFIVIGGDIAYTDAGQRDYRDGQGESFKRWQAWFDIAKKRFITEERRIIPVVVAIGNHEVWGGYYDRHPGYEQNDLWRQRIAQVFYQAFPSIGQPGYGVLDVGDYLSLVLLDTDHSNPIDGVQTQWLAETLKARDDGRRVFPVYHVPAYPSIRSYQDKTQTRVREHWVPLFDAHNIQVAFEHHDHIYKRSEPIRAGAVDPQGVVYLGDGSFGLLRTNRQAHNPDETWYLNRIALERHFILVEVDKTETRFKAINDRGEHFDTYRTPLPQRATTQK